MNGIFACVCSGGHAVFGFGHRDSNAVASGVSVSGNLPRHLAVERTEGGANLGEQHPWLSWEVPVEGGVYLISTCNEGTTFDTQLALWEASDCTDFNSFALLNANDDAGCGLGSFRSTMLTPCLQGGETLYLQIDGYYGEVGDVEVSIQAAPLTLGSQCERGRFVMQFAAKFQS